MGASGVLALILVTAVETAAPASPRVRVVTSGELPFSAAEFEKALAARLPTDAPEGTLSLTRRADGFIELSWSSMSRAVDVSNDTGSAAARVVALLAADLFVPLTPPTLVLPPLPSGPPAVMPGPRAPAQSAATHFALGYQVTAGGDHYPTLHGFALSSGHDSGRARLRVAVARMSASPQNLVTTTAWSMRLEAGVGNSYLALLGGLVMLPYHAGGPIEFSRILVGPTGGLEGRFPIVWGLSLRASAGCDVFSGRQQVMAGEAMLLQTPRASLRFGLALGWEMSR